MPLCRDVNITATALSLAGILNLGFICHGPMAMQQISAAVLWSRSS